ncbi:response regulator [Virgibacillus sp. FSP13]
MSVVLIADDSRFMRMWLKRILQQYGYKDVVEAIDGQEAIDQYKQVRPEIVFLDITMPNVNGLTALTKIIKFDSKAKVVMCSALGTKTNIIKALQIGAKDFVVKPNFDSLINILEKLEDYSARV